MTPHDPARSPSQVTLGDALARLRADLHRHHAPPRCAPAPAPVATPAMAVPSGSALSVPAAPGPGPGWPAWAAAAVLLGACGWVLWSLPAARPGLPAAGGDAGLIGAGPATRPQPAGTGFVPVASAERLAELWRGGADTAPAWVLRTELPRERLAALGLPYDPARAAEPVAAELLMHPTGDVLAVRLVAH